MGDMGDSKESFVPYHSLEEIYFENERKQHQTSTPFGWTKYGPDENSVMDTASGWDNYLGICSKHFHI